MSRIRTIKPELPQSETIGKLSRDGRLLFIQLFTIADDAGRFRAASRMLASLLYPYDDDAPKLIGAWLDELERNKIIRRWVIDGDTYGEIVNWLKHQKIDRPSPSRLPAYDDKFAKPREDSRTLDADLGPSTMDLVPVPSISCSTSLSDWPSDFRERFWERYPRRIGKRAAIKALEKIKRSGVSFSTLMAGVSRIPTTELQFIPHPTTWLNRGGWDDEIGGFTPNIGGPPEGLSAEQRAKWIRDQMERERAEKSRADNGVGAVLEGSQGVRGQERVGPKLVCDNTRDAETS